MFEKLTLSHRRFAGLITASLFLLLPMVSRAQIQPPAVVCSDGNGSFETEFRTGVKVHIGAAKDGGLATRSCTANLSWQGQALVVAAGAKQIDLDAFGTDFGDGIPIAAFQIKKTDSDCCMAYEVFSLQKPVKLIRTITGGEFFAASDLELDDTVEIFTNDAAAVDGFDRIALAEMDSPPMMVLRLTNTNLQDVSTEFQLYFDNQIRDLRAAIDPHDLNKFRNSDGVLLERTTGSSPEELHKLRDVKVKILEIIWAYLYSGREQEAWRSLAAMWPTSDLDQIRAALLKARASGIRRELDNSPVVPARHKKKHARVFDAVSGSEEGSTLEVVPPEPILLQRPPGSQQRGELVLELVVDRAGKVRSAEPVSKASWADADVISAAHTWKFIPAFKNGRAVASRLHIAVSPKQ